MVKGIVKAVCLSETKGIAKKDIKKALFIENYGMEKDAHAGNWHRQISLLSYEQVEAFRKRGVQVEDGAFGENLLVSGIEFKLLPIGSKIICNEVELEVTQIGKECHSGCEIFNQVGDCIMPREGIFAVVKKGGIIHTGDEMYVQETI